jgi:hypothetical protein
MGWYVGVVEVHGDTESCQLSLHSVAYGQIYARFHSRRECSVGDFGLNKYCV